MIYIGAAASAILFILQVVGIINISGWLIALPFLLGVAWVAGVILIALIIAAIANM
jgi:hypothetical protein